MVSQVLYLQKALAHGYVRLSLRELRETGESLDVLDYCGQKGIFSFGTVELLYETSNLEGGFRPHD